MNKNIEKNIYEIREILASFEKKDFDRRTSFYYSSGFPTGCCGDTTNLLGLYLLQYHELESDYVCGQGLGGNSGQSHAWLVCQGHIIDITADQFNGAGYELPSVIIDIHSSFHELFDKTKSRQISIEKFKDSGIPSVLEKVMTVMKARENHL